MLAAILICGTSTMLTSCSDNEDNPVGTFDPASAPATTASVVTSPSATRW